MMENAKRRRIFPDAFKWEAVTAIRGGRTASQVVAELGLPDRLVRAWIRWAAGGFAQVAVRRRRRPHKRRRCRRAAWAPARPTRPLKSPGSARNSSAHAWSATS